MFSKWPPNIERPEPEPPVDPNRPPYKTKSEQEEAVLATADFVIMTCDEEIARLRSLKGQTGGVS